MPPGSQRDARASAARRSRAVRLFYTEDGHLRSGRVGVVVAALVVLIVVGTFAVFILGIATDPTTLAIGALIVFLGLKLPLLALAWWLLTRHAEPARAEWSPEEREEILAYLQQQAADCMGRPDAAERLAYLAQEAWHVADTAPDDQRAHAVQVAVSIAGLRSRAETRRRSRRPEQR